MKFIEDSITNDLYQNCVKELNEKKDQYCWRSSSITWVSGVKQGIIGSCITTPVSDTIHHSLEKQLKLYLPKYDELIFEYYIWQPQSGISWHNDKASDRLFGATLYLNDLWHPDSGGWFIWKDDRGHHTILPEKKLLVINDQNQYHCVTPVSSSVFRCTIQLWGNY